MLREAHIASEAMSGVASAVKDERWSDALAKLEEAQQLIDKLKQAIADKQRSDMMLPKVDRGDRE